MLQSPSAFDHADAPSPALDRRVHLTALSWEGVGWIAAVLVAALVRLIQQTTWPLGATEAGIAADGLALATGGTLSPSAWTHPLVVEAEALALFLFGPSDAVVRLVPAVAGLGALLLLRPLRHWVGRSAALAAAVLLALSPTLTFAARIAGSAALLVPGSLLVLVLVLRHCSQPTTASAAATGVAAGLLLLTGPLGWLALPLTAAAGAAIAGGRRARIRDLSGLLLGVLLTVIALSTVLFTRPEGFAAFLSGSLGALWRDHLATAGAAWWMTPLVLVADELLALVLAVAGAWVVLTAPGSLPFGTARTARGLLGWTTAALIVASVLGGPGVAQYSLAVLPLALLAGVGLGSLSEAIRWREVWSARGVAFLVAVFLTFAALFSTFNTLGRRPAPTEWLAWLITLLILVALVLVPLALAAVWLTRRLDQRAAPLVGLAGLLILAGVTLRTSVLLGATNVTRPGEPLLIGSTAPDVTHLLARIEKVSADLTTFTQDTRDPTGGHGLTIVLDEEIAQPFAWYLRDFPNLRIVSAGQPVTGPVAPQVVIALPEHIPALGADTADYVMRPYALEVTTPPRFARPDWGALLLGMTDPSEVRHFAEFLMDRRVSVPAEPRMFALTLRDDVAQRVYGSDGAGTTP
ncbi:MAG: glycosyltransferase family 39 protein [Sphaerobacter sp.]|nr:glycosyltransferase family 39 protein [Sphaerobacter sp.]